MQHAESPLPPSHSHGHVAPPSCFSPGKQPRRSTPSTRPTCSGCRRGSTSSRARTSSTLGWPAHVEGPVPRPVQPRARGGMPISLQRWPSTLDPLRGVEGRAAELKPWEMRAPSRPPSWTQQKPDEITERMHSDVPALLPHGRVGRPTPTPHHVSGIGEPRWRGATGGSGQANAARWMWAVHAPGGCHPPLPQLDSRGAGGTAAEAPTE